MSFLPSTERLWAKYWGSSNQRFEKQLKWQKEKLHIWIKQLHAREISLSPEPASGSISTACQPARMQRTQTGLWAVEEDNGDRMGQYHMDALEAMWHRRRRVPVVPPARTVEWPESPRAHGMEMDYFDASRFLMTSRVCRETTWCFPKADVPCGLYHKDWCWDQHFKENPLGQTWNRVMSQRSDSTLFFRNHSLWV